MLIVKGGVCLFHKNLKEVSVSFKIRGGVGVILIDLKGGECNFPYLLSYLSLYILTCHFSL